MWNQIRNYFKDLPAQQKVAKLLFERGFQVNDGGNIVSGHIEIPHTQIAKEVGVDRRNASIKTSAKYVPWKKSPENST